MKYTIIHILCEGPTEERFVKDVLSPYLRQFGISTKTVLLLTSKKKNAYGGMLGYCQVKGDLSRLLKQYPDNNSERHLFTTMFDYYALPDDFPGFDDAARKADVRDRVAVLEKELKRAIGSDRLFPYIQIHEFEALLFSDISGLKSLYPRAGKQIDQLKKETDVYRDPEMINNSVATAPSKRIIKAVASVYSYNKVQSGAALAKLIGINALLERCRHFREWVEILKSQSL